jgi:hypothetical protein
MNWKGWGRKLSWPLLRYNPIIFIEVWRITMVFILFRIASVWDEISVWNILNMKQEYQPPHPTAFSHMLIYLVLFTLN